MKKSTVLYLLAVLIALSFMECKHGRIYKRFKGTNNLYGYVDNAGRIVVKPQYWLASEFTDDRFTLFLRNDLTVDTIAMVQEPNKSIQFMDRNGNIIEQLTGKFSDLMNGFSEGLCTFSTYSPGWKKWGYINKFGDEIIKQQFLFAGSFKDGQAKVRLENCKTATINTQGRIIDLPVYDPPIDPEKLIPYDNSGVYWYYYKDLPYKGHRLFTGFEKAYPFNENLGLVKQNGLMGFIDADGEYVFTPQFASATDFQNGVSRVSLPNDTLPYLLYRNGRLTPVLVAHSSSVPSVNGTNSEENSSQRSFASGHGGSQTVLDKVTDAVSGVVTPQATANEKRAQRGAVKMLLAPDQKTYDQGLNDVIESAVKQANDRQ